QDWATGEEVAKEPTISNRASFFPSPACGPLAAEGKDGFATLRQSTPDFVPMGFPPTAGGKISLAGDRSAVLELGLYQRPGAAGRAAAQRINRQHQLVTGLERLGRHAVARKDARRRALQIPHCAG